MTHEEDWPRAAPDGLPPRPPGAVGGDQPRTYPDGRPLGEQPRARSVSLPVSTVATEADPFAEVEV